MEAITDQQARQVLAALIVEGKLSPRGARLALARHKKRIAQLKAELARLEGGDGPFPTRRRAERRSSRPARRKRISASRKRAMRQQGKYLAAVRGLKAQDRKKVKAVRQKEGWRAAMAAARRLRKA